jgi:hypothetical protein
MAITASKVVGARTHAELVILVAAAIAASYKPVGKLTFAFAPNGDRWLYQGVAVDASSTVTAYSIVAARTDEEFATLVAIEIAAGRRPIDVPVGGTLPHGDPVLYQVCVAGSPSGFGGSSGADGATWRIGAGAPDNAVGADNDLYLRTSNGDVYKRTAGVYGVQGNIKGAAGPTGARTINPQTGTTYTFVANDGSDANLSTLVTLSNAAAITATIPPNSDVPFAVGAQIDVLQLGAGKLTIAPGAGVTLNSEGGNKSAAAQYAALTLLKIATDTWVIIGSTIA